MQVLAAIKKLRSGSLEDRVFREQRIYDLWTLSELMNDYHCQDEFVSHSLLPLIAQFLREDNSAGRHIPERIIHAIPGQFEIPGQQFLAG